jgi:transcriptional regulator with XRE-family HTH domain
MSYQRPRLVNIEALHAALDTRRAAEGWHWQDVAHAMGVSASLFTRMKAGRSPDLDGYVACCQWLRVPMDTFTGQPATDGDLCGELVALLSRHGVREVYWRALGDLIAALKVS